MSSAGLSASAPLALMSLTSHPSSSSSIYEGSSSARDWFSGSGTSAVFVDFLTHSAPLPIHPAHMPMWSDMPVTPFVPHR